MKVISQLCFPVNARFFMGRWHVEVPSPGIAAFIGFAAQAKFVRFAFALHTPSLSVLIQVTQGIGV